MTANSPPDDNNNNNPGFPTGSGSSPNLSYQTKAIPTQPNREPN
jgi:hypothetical protein